MNSLNFFFFFLNCAKWFGSFFFFLFLISHFNLYSCMNHLSGVVGLFILIRKVSNITNILLVWIFLVSFVIIIICFFLSHEEVDDESNILIQMFFLTWTEEMCQDLLGSFFFFSFLIFWKTKKKKMSQSNFSRMALFLSFLLKKNKRNKKHY